MESLGIAAEPHPRNAVLYKQHFLLTPEESAVLEEVRKEHPFSIGHSTGTRQELLDASTLRPSALLEGIEQDSSLGEIFSVENYLREGEIIVKYRKDLCDGSRDRSVDVSTDVRMNLRKISPAYTLLSLRSSMFIKFMLSPTSNDSRASKVRVNIPSLGAYEMEFNDLLRTYIACKPQEKPYLVSTNSPHHSIGMYSKGRINFAPLGAAQEIFSSLEHLVTSIHYADFQELAELRRQAHGFEHNNTSQRALYAQKLTEKVHSLVYQREKWAHEQRERDVLNAKRASRYTPRWNSTQIG